MIAEIYNTEAEADARQLEWYNLKKDLPKYIGDKYSDVFQHLMKIDGLFLVLMMDY